MTRGSEISRVKRAARRLRHECARAHYHALQRPLPHHPPKHQGTQSRSEPGEQRRRARGKRTRWWAKLFFAFASVFTVWQTWSLSEQSFLSCVGHHGSGDLEFYYPRGIAIDKHHRRIVVTDTNNNRLVFLSSIDLSFLFSIGKKLPPPSTLFGGSNVSNHPGEFYCPTSVAIDDDRHRIIVSDSFNHRVQVLSSIDGSFLFEFGSKGNQPCQFINPLGLCIANQGRIIVADWYNYRLQSFTHEGHHISSFDCGREKPSAVAFDKHRGLIAFTAGNRVHVIGANQWLADTFSWRVDRHRYAPSWMKQAVSTMTMIRSVVDDSSGMSMIPNELLFEIFSFL